MSGHWYCSACNDVIPNMHAPTGRWDLKDGVKCYVCSNHSCRWVDTVESLRGKVTRERAKELFQKLYKASEETLPEDLRPNIHPNDVTD